MSERDLSKPKPRAKKSGTIPGGGPPEYSQGQGAPCKTCSSPLRLKIEQQIVEGQPWLRIARNFGNVIHSQSIKRHAVICIPEIMNQRAASICDEGKLSRELIEDHANRLLERADTVVEEALDVDEEGAPRETAMGRAAVLRAHGDSIKIAGQVIGMFDSKTKLEILLKDPGTQEALMKLIDTLCPECCVAAREVLADLVK